MMEDIGSEYVDYVDYGVVIFSRRSMGRLRSFSAPGFSACILVDLKCPLPWMRDGGLDWLRFGVLSTGIYSRQLKVFYLSVIFVNERNPQGWAIYNTCRSGLRREPVDGREMLWGGAQSWITRQCR